MNTSPYIALGSRLLGIPEVITLGVKPNFSEYTSHEKKLITNSRLILYPTLNYAQFFTTMDMKIFPSVETYLYADEKIKQTTLFTMLNIPHPRTKFFYRPKHHLIEQDFNFPFIAKFARGSSRGRGVFLIHNKEELDQYLQCTKIAYIQEYLPHKRDLRVILINYQLVLAYWRHCGPDTFKTNLHQGGKIVFEDIPEEIIKCAEQYARMCKLNDVGFDFIHSKGNWHLIEANMLYGRQGLKEKGLVLKEIIREKLISGELTGSC